MKNLLILVAFAAIVVFAGKFYIEYNYEKGLDDAISLAAPYATVTYDRVELGLDGSLSLHKLNVRVPASGETVSVAEIKMESSDRFLVLKGESAFEGGKYPESFTLSFSRLEMDSNLIEVAPAKDQCRNFATTFAYSEIGLERIRANGRLSFDFRDPYNATVSLYYSDDIATSDIQWVMDASALASAAVSGEAPLREASISTELNAEVASAIAEYCAEVFKISAEEFLNKVVGSAKFSINSFGADLGPDFRAALVTFMRGGSLIELRSTPSKQLLEFSNAQFFKAKDVVRWLNLKMTADGVAVPIKVIEEVKPKKVVKKVKKGVYTKTSVGQARDHIGQTIRIQRTNDRSAIKGRLLATSGDTLDVEIYRYTGVMTFSVPKSDVASLEVYSLVEQ